MPACDTTPLPSTVTTGNDRRDLVAFTQKVPLRTANLDPERVNKPSFPYRAGTFPISGPVSPWTIMNQPG